MTTDLDLSKITQAIDLLKQQLPPENDELAQRLNQQTILWKATVQEARNLLAIQQCLQLIAKEEHTSVLERINNILQADNPEAKTAPTEGKVIKPNYNTKKRPPDPPKDPRKYCWDLAHNPSQSELTKISHQQAAPTNQPQTGDIVLHGTVSNAASPIWIAPIETIPMFSQLIDTLTFINPNGQIWLDFSDIYTAQHLDLPIPKWCQDKPDTHLLWHRWIDLLYWTVMTPDYSVFLTGKQKLSSDKEVILTDLLTIHKNFTKGFDTPEKHAEFLGHNLHKLYSVFYKFLSVEDMDFDTVPKHVFANLRRSVNSNVKIWQEQLGIREEHPAGPLNSRNRSTKEYLGNVNSYTDSMNNIELDLQHPFSQKAEISQVLYWTTPNWKQTKLAPTHHYFDLKGSVLYCYT